MSKMPPTQPSSPPITLEKASLDFSSLKVQMVAGTVLVLIACFASYCCVLKTGFLLDDFLHVNYVADAFAGHWQAFLHNFTGNWAGSDIMRSYRPIASLSFFMDYLLYGTHALGFHLTNVLLLFGCSLFVGLIVLEITGLSGNRLGAAAAIWSALLFVVYPLHPEACAWIVGRVDLLCCLFYLVSVFCYLRFRLIREPAYLWSSLLSFLAALASKEMAVTLPLVIFAAELFLYARPHGEKLIQAAARFKYVFLFVLVLAAYAVLRTIVLHTVVGGYGSGGLHELVHSFRNFLDKATLIKTFLPMNEEISFSSLVKPALISIYAIATIVLASRLLSRTAKLGPFLFLLVWCGLAIAPTFQVWHIYPNLVGSRLFFVSSAPFCMFWPLALLPCIDIITRQKARALTAVGTCLLALLFGLWSYLLAGNLKPWIIAGQQMQNLRAQVDSFVKDSTQTVLLNLPTDYSGAGMLTRSLYLNILSSRPFSSQDNAGKLSTIEPIISGNRDLMWPRQFKELLAASPSSVYIWDHQSGRFVPWRMPDGANEYSLVVDKTSATSLVSDSKNAVWGDGETWHVMSDKYPSFIRYSNFVRVYPGSSGATLFFPSINLNPMKASLAIVDFSATDAHGCGQCLGSKVKLVWQSEAGNKDMSEALIGEPLRGQHLVWLGRYRAWTLDGSITKLGIHLEPGNYFVDFRGVKIASDDTLVPIVKLNGTNRAIYDASCIPGAQTVQAFISKSGTTFDSLTAAEVASTRSGTASSSDIAVLDAGNSKGQIQLPDEIANSPELHQVRIVAQDKFGMQVGLPSEPVTLQK